VECRLESLTWAIKGKIEMWNVKILCLNLKISWLFYLCMQVFHVTIFFLNAGCFSRYLQVESCCSCQDLETCHLIIFLLLMLVYDQSSQVMLLFFYSSN
jgi:hypothetical protein